MRKVLFLCFGFMIVFIVAQAQGTALPLGNETYPILDRLTILSGQPAPFHPSLRYYPRGAATRYALMLDTAGVMDLSKLDQHDLNYIFEENNEWLGAPTHATTLGGKKEKTPEDLTQIEASMADPRYTRSKHPFLKYFYRTPANFVEINDKNFHFRLNPLFYFFAAKPQSDSQLVFTNLRGVELRGGVDDRIYFYANIMETQARFPGYVNERIDRDIAIPGAGFYKSYNSQVFDIKEGYDFLNAQGYIGFNITRHVGAQFGYGRNFIGSGYRSLLLSDFSNNYLYLKLNWNVWKLHYQNIFAELAAQSDKQTPEGQVIPKKYMAAHHLSIDLWPHFNIGLFEAVVFSRNNGFELNYLNPVILYRTAEQGLNSPDNVLIGLDGHWDIARHVRLYGQLILDEFVFKELVVERRGWWGNKYGLQAGAQYVNALGVDHLDLRLEFNMARPYTYSYTDSSANYTNYNQPLAHPLGANFREWLLMVRYQPLTKLLVEARLINAVSGEDDKDSNWGGNPLLPNSLRERQYENGIGQGIRADIALAGLDISYQLAHNVFIDLNYFYRKKKSEDPLRSGTTQFLGGGIRINIGRQRMDF